MTKLEETNEMIKAANKLLNTPREHSGIAINEAVRTVSLLDIAKSLAIIADGITDQNEQMEKIESDLCSIERKYDSKLVQWPPRTR